LGKKAIGVKMDPKELPQWYQILKEKYPGYIDALNELGSSARKEGPLDAKTGHLIQLAGAAASRSEGAVHSHTRQLLELGANAEEINHAIILLTSTIGFPAVSAALSWADDILGK
jgi:AhpD family alkylhydroperoxidase